MLSTQLIILNYHVVYDGDAVYLTNSNFLNSCFKGEPMRIIYRMRGKKKKKILAVIFIEHNFDAIRSYLVHSIDHRLRLFAREA